MKKLVVSCVIVLIFIPILALGQSPKTEFTRMYLPVWEEARNHCLEVAKSMPEEKYTSKPTELSKTFAEQMVHIAYTIPLLTKRVH